MQRFKNKHLGKNIWVFGAAPSLCEIDTMKIPNDDIIIACNSSLLKAHRFNYACFVDGSIHGFEYYKKVLEVDCDVILFNEEIQKLSDRTFYIKKKQNRLDWALGINDNEVVFGFDVIHCAVHFAMVLGAHEIILCGVDLKGTAGFKYWEDKEKIPLKTNELYMEEWAIPTDDGKRDAEGTDRCLHYSMSGWESIIGQNADLPITVCSTLSIIPHYQRKTFEECIHRTKNNSI